MMFDFDFAFRDMFKVLLFSGVNYLLVLTLGA